MTKFNTQQLEAINFHKGACNTTASPGSGKTTVLINRIKTLVEVHNELERDILAISFTRNTADELKKKLQKIGLEYVQTGTFHSICGKILFEEGIEITNKNLIKDWQVENCFKAIDKKADVKEIKSFIGYQKNYLRKVKDQFVYKSSPYTESELRVFYAAYESMKQKEGLYDFDDYLLLALDVLQNNKGKYTYEFVLVDEHQDSNLIQSLLLTELCQSGNIFAVHDPKQAIYGFRGGNPEYSMNFEKYWKDATTINLFKNYRSARNIVENSNNFIRPYFADYKHYVDAEAHNQVDGEITLNTYFDQESEAVEVADKIEALIEQGENLSEIAVLYRLNSNSNHIENELKKRNVEYEIMNDSSFFKRKEIVAILAYLRLIQNPHDNQAMETIFKARNHPLKYFSNKLFDDIRKFAALHNMSLYEGFITYTFENKQKKSANEFENSINRLRLQNDKEVSVVTLIGHIVSLFEMDSKIKETYDNEEELQDRLNSLEVLKSFVKGNNLEQFITYVYSNNTKKKSKKDSVKLMSAHSSKGLEFSTTYLIGIEQKKFPHYKSTIEEEARLFYVAVTRAKKNLHISQIGAGNRFIREYFGKDK